MFLLIGLLFSGITSVAVASAENKGFQYFAEYGEKARRAVDHLIRLDKNFQNLCNATSEKARLEEIAKATTTEAPYATFSRFDCNKAVAAFDKLSQEPDLSKIGIDDVKKALSFDTALKIHDCLQFGDPYYQDPITCSGRIEKNLAIHRDYMIGELKDYKAGR
jgi:hypothetical protein